LFWTPEQDAQLRGLGDNGRAWQKIAATLSDTYRTPITAESARKRYLRLSVSPGPAAVNARAPRIQHSSGWEPGVVYDGTQGTITSRPVSEPVQDWDKLIRVWGLDPAEVEVIEPVQMRAWDTIVEGETKTLYYYKANLRKRRSSHTVDVSDLIAQIEGHRPSQRPLGTTETPRALVVALSDWQLGKSGGEAGIERILSAIDMIVRYIADQRKIGRPFDRIIIASLGDTIEGCDGHYPSQTFTTELNMRDQVNMARRLFIRYVTTLAPLVDLMVVAAVGGNHGENRRNGEAYTDPSDNLDVAVWEQVADVIAVNPAAYGHVSFVLPRNELSLTLDVLGTIVAIAHGHKLGRGSNSQAKAESWWRDQAFGRQAAGDADVLVTGHYHHFTVTEDAGRVHIQTPTQDSGSQWWSDITGKGSQPGQLIFSIDGNGWGGDATVLR